jgi:hypothetical protein
MSAQPYEQPLQPDDEVLKAQQALREANIRWGREIGAYEAEVHDINSARAIAAADQAELAGRKLVELLGHIKRQPSVGLLVSPKGIFRALGKILGH